MTERSLQKNRTAAVWISLILCLALLMGLSACGEDGMPKENVVQVYYLSNSETKIEAHEIERPTGPAEEQIRKLLAYLSAIPEKLTYKAPLTLGFSVQSMEYFEGQLSLNMNAAYLDLKPTTEVLVRAALVRTLTQINGVDRVQITVDGKQLYDSAGEAVGWMNADQFIQNDGSEINTYDQVRVKLYFANEAGDKLIAAYREKFYSTNTPLERFVVEELIKGPTGKVEGIYPSVNPDTKILSVMTKDGICYVNLDSSFLSVVNNVSSELSIYAIVNSLAELTNINKVQILVDGETPANFGNAVFERDLDYVTVLEEN